MKKTHYVVPKSKERLDKLVIELGLCDSRHQAQGLILSGNILVDGLAIRKAGALVPKEARVERLQRPKFVSRGGFKLEKAIREFAASPNQKTCLDVGSSTGGFVDCLLQNGATMVYAVDSGTNQLHASIASNPKVEVFERTNARHLDRALFKKPIEFITMDVSFISVRTIIKKLASMFFGEKNIDLVVLVKPQFEAGRKQVPKGGVVKKPEVHLATLVEVAADCKRMNAALYAATHSPIPGRKGNIEYLFHLVLNPKKRFHSAIASTEEAMKNVVEAAFEDLG